MAQYILVMAGDEHPTQWIGVVIADSADTIKAMGCYDRNDPVALSKADYPGVKVCQIVIPNCATPDVPENGTIYEINHA
jgi:hypothetical protein